ncbi:MAG: DUF1987 domain-containing protein [Bacteroidales bacterium]|nr:DUF1987 domain-containing protein [Bacteroidales bacterium]
MIEKFYLEETSTTPEVIFDPENGLFSIKGRSLPEDTETAYESVMDWLQQYKESPNPETTLCIRLDYYNSSSLRKLADILLLVKEVSQKPSASVSVKWYYEDGDDSSVENAEDLKFATNLPFDIIPLED